MRLVTLAVCNLNQWAMDFEGNLQRILDSIRQAKEKGATYRLGPELEVPGYSCEDHFFEEDLYYHCWEVIVEILKSGVTEGILCDVGMPVSHRNVRYNCRVFLLNGKILLIRPKIFLANDGNYRETRWFTAWGHQFQLEDYYLPSFVRHQTGQQKIPFGEAAIATLDTVLGVETCEELFTPNSPHIYLGLNGVEIIANGSGSHHQLRKLNTRIDLIQSATAKGGGVYLYSNQRGCDGNRMYFDGCAMIVLNGKVLAQADQFSLEDVQVVTATVSLEEIKNYRGGIASRGVQAAEAVEIKRIDVDFSLKSPNLRVGPTKPREVKYFLPEEEIGYGPACWLWDYLRRSNANGYFLPLSGGADSAATCAIVGLMCQLVIDAINAGDQNVLQDVQRVANQKSDWIPKDPKEIAKEIFFTCYMGTVNSSETTKNRAKHVAEQIGATHSALTMDQITEAYAQVFKQVSNRVPKFKTHGGSYPENIALQNIQARSRMCLSYYLSGLLLWANEKKGWLLVLGSANVDESLRGYFTKYDCSSADVNPIGGIAKGDLKSFLVWAAEKKGWSALDDVVKATPTAELEPEVEGYVQSDEVDMGMSYAELGVFGRLRKMDRCGPLNMFERLVYEWDHLEPKVVAEKVKRFFYYYSINRHKMTTLTPSYHAEAYGPDDNRFDLRQFLYNSKWTWQFKAIDRMLVKYESEGVGGKTKSKM